MARFVPQDAPVVPNIQISLFRFIVIVLPIQCSVSFYILANYIVSNHYFSPFQSFFVIQAWCGIIVVCLLVYVAFRAFLILRCLQRIEQRRMALAQGDLRWRLGTPGIEVSAVVPETFSIERRMNRVYILFVAILVLGYTTFVPIAMDIFPLSLLFTIPLDVFLIFVAASLWMSRSVIEIAHEGCILRSKGRGSWGASRQRIAWSDIRLFACYTLPNFLGRDVVQYELSSQRERIYWRQIAEDSAAFSLLQPIYPREIYQQQMHLLPALITEKTGLPLLDLDQLPDLQER